MISTNSDLSRCIQLLACGSKAVDPFSPAGRKKINKRRKVPRFLSLTKGCRRPMIASIAYRRR